MSKAIAKANNSVHLEDLNRALEALEFRRQTLRTQLHNQIITVEPPEYTQLISLSKIVAILRRLTEQVYSDVNLIGFVQKGDNRKIRKPVTTDSKSMSYSRKR